MLVAVRVTRRDVSFEVIEESFTFGRHSFQTSVFCCKIASAARIQCLWEFICRVLITYGKMHINIVKAF